MITRNQEQKKTLLSKFSMTWLSFRSTCLLRSILVPKKRFVNSCLSRCVVIKGKTVKCLSHESFYVWLFPRNGPNKMSKKRKHRKGAAPTSVVRWELHIHQSPGEKNIKIHRQPIDETKLHHGASSYLHRPKLRFCLVPESLSIPSLSWGMLRDWISPEKTDRFLGSE